MSRILYLADKSITLFHAARHGASAGGRFTLDEEGYGQLRRALSSPDARPVALLVDLIEEEFREELLPHAYGGDRARLQERQANKLFRTTPFRYSRITGRMKEGRRDSRVLFSALTNRDNVEPLLDLLNELRIPLAGIYSLPLITHHLVRHLAADNGHILVITEQPGEGLRETYVCDNKVLFSRLAPISASSPEDYCRIILDEAHKTHRYLTTLRLIPYGAELEIHALTDSTRADAMRTACADETGISYHPANLSEIAQRAGFREHPDARISDALFAYLLNTRRVPNHYATPRHLKRLNTWHAQAGLRAAMWLIAVTAATYSGINVVDGMAMSSEARNVASVAAQVNTNYQQAARQLPVTAEDARAMREAIQLANTLEAHRTDLASLFSLVGNAFERQPNLQLKRFDWFASPDKDAATASQDSARQADRVQNMDNYLVSHIKGKLRHFNGSYVEAHSQIDRLVKWIAERPGVHAVTITRRPLNTQADASIQGAIGNNDRDSEAEFELRVTMEIDHGTV
ncbi:MAG: hypothetical protein ACE5FQ_00170 [Thiogranum sp.]